MSSICLSLPIMLYVLIIYSISIRHLLAIYIEVIIRTLCMYVYICVCVFVCIQQLCIHTWIKYKPFHN
jgi:hypothetical protein